MSPSFLDPTHPVVSSITMGILILAIFLIGAGLFMLAKPIWLWGIFERWKSSDATEPSSLYVLSLRFGGVVCLVVGILNVMVYFLQ
jgi:hypothetical protein